jgi:hypothetical protein
MQRKSYLLILFSLILALTLSSERSILAQTAPPGGEGTTAIQAAITPVMSYQGRLVEGGTPVTGPRSMTFSLYTASTAGTLIWSEVQSVTVTNGLFQVALGSVTPFSEAALGQMYQNLWLEINVGGTILPRQQLMGAPYALSLAPGATVAGGTARTLSVANLGSGAGLWSHGETGHGMIASSNGTGLDGSALQAQAYGKEGIAAWALASSTDASLVVSNDGEGPLVKGFGGDGGEHEFAILNDGTFQQELEASGLVKAAVFAYCDESSSSIVRSFNNVGGTITILSGGSPGVCMIDFGFPVIDHYFSVTAPATMSAPVLTYAVCAMDSAAYGTDVLVCARQHDDGTGYNGYIMIVVY